MKVLAIDMGATSIRGLIGQVVKGRLELEEVMRLAHRYVEKDGRRHWQRQEIIQTIVKTINEQDSSVQSVAVDTWGVDFGLIDQEGNLIQDPVSYRDSLHDYGFAAISEQIDLPALFEQTGNQIMSINTLFQVKVLADKYPEIYKKAKHLLFTPDLVSYFLSGAISSEKTIASTSQMFDLVNQVWNYDLVESLDLNSSLLAPIVDSGTYLGNTKNAKVAGINKEIDVYTVAGHDTAAAVAVTNAFTNPNCLFLSSGTWSLIGCLAPTNVSKEAFLADLTNETGYLNENMLFKNITGLYIVELLLKELRLDTRYEELTVMASEARPFACFFDVTAISLDSVSVLDSLTQYAEKSGQKMPVEPGLLFRSVYESLVLSYLETMESLASLTKRNFDQIHVIGGGSSSALLCQMIADALNLSLIAGPKEASAIGNIIIQMISQNIISSKAEADRIVAESFAYQYYEAKDHDSWQLYAQRASEIKEKMRRM